MWTTKVPSDAVIVGTDMDDSQGIEGMVCYFFTGKILILLTFLFSHKNPEGIGFLPGRNYRLMV